MVRKSYYSLPIHLDDEVVNLDGLGNALASGPLASANQAAVSATSIGSLSLTFTSTTPWGFSSEADAQAMETKINALTTRVEALTTLVNQLRADLVAATIIKGSA